MVLLGGGANTIQSRFPPLSALQPRRCTTEAQRDKVLEGVRLFAGHPQIWRKIQEWAGPELKGLDNVRNGREGMEGGQREVGWTGVCMCGIAPCTASYAFTEESRPACPNPTHNDWPSLFTSGTVRISTLL